MWFWLATRLTHPIIMSRCLPPCSVQGADCGDCCAAHYGGSKDYVSRVIEAGPAPVREEVHPADELSVGRRLWEGSLCKAKVLVFNHHRQQGLGNAVLFLALKRKIFIRSDVTSYDYFRGIGIRIHDTVKLMQGEENLFDFDTSQRGQEREILLMNFPKENLVKLWNQVFKIRF